MNTRTSLLSKSNAVPARPLLAKPGILQRKCACGGSAGGTGKCEDCERKDQALQSQATGVGAALAPPIVHDVLNAPGQALDSEPRAFFEPRFGHDFAAVRVHTDQRAAQSAAALHASAYTVGRHIVFGDRQYAPATERGRGLLAHELTHVLQQGLDAEPPLRRASPNALRVVVDQDGLEQEAEAAGATFASGIAARPPQQASEVAIQRAPPLAGGRPSGSTLPYREATELAACVRIMGEDSAAYCRQQVLGEKPPGPRETLFLAGGKAFEDTLGTTAQHQPVKVYYFPGQTDERALVIGGVHGSELSGIEVAELLVQSLKTATTPPYYTVAVVPSLFPDNRALAESQPSKIGTADNIGRYTMTGGKRGKDPNRQMPALGEALNTANPVDAQGAVIEPENIMLLELIDRFHPTRIASVHATRPEGGKDASGIYADPKTDENQIALGVDEDAKLAIKMAERAKKEGANVPGNKLDATPTALYPLDKPFVAKGQKQPRKTAEGISLGGWGTTAVRGGRAPMTVITVEVQTANPSLKPGDPETKRNQQRLKELNAHRIALQEVFLGPP